MVEETVRSERSRRASSSPIYLVGESFGGCLALAVASRNPQLHLLLILANPGTTSPPHLTYPKPYYSTTLPIYNIYEWYFNIPLH